MSTQDLMMKIKNKAREDLKTIVLPEAMDERIIKAAGIIASEGFSRDIILLGDEENIHKKSKEYGVSLKGVKIIDYIKSKKKTEYAEIYYQLRKHKNITFHDAMSVLEDPLYFGCFMVKEQDADVLVAGSINTTANLLRAALQIIGKKPKANIVSSSFIMIVPNCEYGEKGIFAFADAGVIPDPTPPQLADIAVSTAQTFELLVGCQPRIAMLSFSTKGSAQHWMVDKVIEATRIIKENNPGILIDGELQADSAIVPFVGKRKDPTSPVAGNANVLIFPDLNSASIAYKLTERLAKAKAYGPLIQGLNKPISDLSRGCSVEDIVDISALTIVRAQRGNR